MQYDTTYINSDIISRNKQFSVLVYAVMILYVLQINEESPKYLFSSIYIYITTVEISPVQVDN